MYSYARAILYAIFLWGTVFFITFLMYPIRTESPMLFATVRMLVTALFSMFLTVMYFRDVEDHTIREGIKLGVLWLLAGIILDQGPFVWGLMRLSFPEYLRDAGVGYLLYPIVTVGAGFLLSADRNAVEDSEASGHLTTPYAPFLSGPGKTPSPKKTDPGART